MKRLAIYGKGGIGKSTTVSNMSAQYARMGFKVMQIGCDPKADSTINLNGGSRIPSVLETMRKNQGLSLENLVFCGDQGVLCVESGGPLPGVGCAGRGIITAFEALEELEAFEVYKPDLVLYDVLGDVVCGGFSLPIRGGYADKVAIVSSGEMMSLYAASNIAYAVQSNRKKGYAELAGLIHNAKNFEGEDDKILACSKEIQAPILHKIPRHPLIQQAEDQGRTVSALFPDSDLAQEYKSLCNTILRALDL